jgi:hypothetical protein
VFETTFNLGDFIFFSVQFEVFEDYIGFDFLFPGREFGYDFPINNPLGFVCRSLAQPFGNLFSLAVC